MKSMNLFGDIEKTSEIMLEAASIQDSKGNLTFNLDDNIYSLNVKSEEERLSILQQINSISKHKYSWFKEKTGKKHWVLYNTAMYKVCGKSNNILHFKPESNLIPTVPINATSCFEMFANINKNSLDLSDFNTCNIVTMYFMFATSSFISLDLSRFDTSNLILADAMFYGCESLNSLDLSSFNTSKLVGTAYMFYRCISLKSIDLSNFDITNVLNMEGMFSGCKSLISLDLSNFRPKKLQIISHMFENCESLEHLDLSNFNTHLVPRINDIFRNCQSLKLLDLSSFKTDFAGYTSVHDRHNMQKEIGIIKMRRINPNDLEFMNTEYVEAHGMFSDCPWLMTVLTEDEKLREYIHKEYPYIRFCDYHEIFGWDSASMCLP